MIDAETLALAQFLIETKREFAALLEFKVRALPLLAELEKLLAERARLKEQLEMCASQEMPAEALRN